MSSSKVTCYVHIIVAFSLGTWGSSGDVATARNKIYIRDAQCAAAKDCNDTVYTLFDTLSGRKTPACPQPPIYRTCHSSTVVHPTAEAVTSAQMMAGRYPFSDRDKSFTQEECGAASASQQRTTSDGDSTVPLPAAAGDSTVVEIPDGEGGVVPETTDPGILRLRQMLIDKEAEEVTK